MRCSLSWLAFGACVLLLTACEDPSNVGLGLVGEEVDAPDIIMVTPSRFDTVATSDVTGNVSRVLAGRVEDALAGTVEATGYVDFLSTTSASDAFREGPVTAATLLLQPDYVYGDSLATLTLMLRNLVTEWDAQDATADTTLEAAGEVTTATFRPVDSLVTVPLPAAWVEARDTTLRGTTFGTSFPGFELTATGGNAVAGFARTGSGLQVVSGGDTLRFPIVETLTHLEQTSPPTFEQPERVVLKDGLGLDVQLDVALGDLLDTFDVINRSRLQVTIDTVLLRSNAASGFVRPLPPIVQLLVVDEAGASFFLDADGNPQPAAETTPSDGVLTFDSPALRQVFELLAAGETDGLDHFRLRIPTASNSVSIAPLYDLATDDGPEVVLTVTRVN